MGKQQVAKHSTAETRLITMKERNGGRTAVVRNRRQLGWRKLVEKECEPVNKTISRIRSKGKKYYRSRLHERDESGGWKGKNHDNKTIQTGGVDGN